MSGALLADLLASLDTAVMERVSEGSFRVLGGLPDWCARLYPEAAAGQNPVRPGDRFPSLGNFLIDAEDHWQADSAGQLKSGPWEERDASGQGYHLEASAVCVGPRQVLLLQSLGAAYDERQALLQRARENSLVHERLTKEIQKKEILLHCIVHDLSGPLMGINGCFSYLDPAKLTDREKQFLEVGLRATQKLDKLIQEILDAFSAEVAALEAFEVDPAQAPDAAACAREVVHALSPACSLNQVTLQLNPDLDLTADWKVVGERSRLERVISNLTENALRHAPPGSAVIVSLLDDAGQVLVAIDDEGPGVPPEVADNLFQKFVQAKGKKRSGKIGLGLYFCRITVEHWGGAIGYAPRPEGGSRFWFRLPRPAAQ